LRGLRGEVGFTLNEMMLAMVLAVIVVAAPLTLIITSLNQQNAVSSRSVAAREAQVGLAQLTRDLREAQNITDSAGANTTPVALTTSGGAATLTFYLPTAGSPSTAGSQITWTCTPSADCTRKVGAGSAIPWIRNVTAATFTGTSTTGTTVTANPAYVSINIQAQVTSLANHTGTQALPGATNSITLQDGVGLRNYS
jgi:type II secretory pathway pseudopilin PulG